MHFLPGILKQGSLNQTFRLFKICPLSREALLVTLGPLQKATRLLGLVK